MFSLVARAATANVNMRFQGYAVPVPPCPVPGEVPWPGNQPLLAWEPLFVVPSHPLFYGPPDPLFSLVVRAAQSTPLQLMLICEFCRVAWCRAVLVGIGN